MAETKTARQLLEDARQFDCDTLIQADKLGESLKLTEVASTVKRTFTLYGYLNADALEILPDQVAVGLSQHLGEVFAFCDQVKLFDPMEPSPQGKRQAFLTDANRLFQQAWGDSHPMLAASARYEQQHLSQRFTELLSTKSAEIEDVVTQFRARADELLDVTRATKTQAESARAALVAATAETGVQFQANKFQEAADEHKRLAKDWLTALIGLSVALAVWAFAGAWAFKAMEYMTSSQLDTPQLVASKILVFAVLSFALIVASRSYFAHCHNTVVNQHRQNALQTYRALVQAAEDPASRDVILQHASGCVYSPQSSGYTKDSSAKPSSVNIIETIGSHLTGRQEV